MSVNPEMQTFHYTGRTAECKAQSVVECRLTGVGEVSSVLTVHAACALLSVEAGDGETKYSGKLLLGVVYEDGERNVCRMERGVEFSHRAADVNITPASIVHAELTVLSSSVRREGASVYVSCVVEAAIEAKGEQRVDYLIGGEGLVCRSEEKTFLREIDCHGQLELDDGFDSDYVVDVLLHSETVSVQKVSVEAGCLNVSGEVAVNICVARPDGLGTQERLLPFRAVLPCDDAPTGAESRAWVAVSSSSVTLSSDEEGGKSRTELNVTLEVRGTVYVRETAQVVQDAFSPINRVALAGEEYRAEYRREGIFLTERLSGVAALSAPIDYSCTLQAIALPRAECSCRTEDGREEVQGAVSCVLLVRDADGLHRKIDVELPFALPFRAADGRKEASAIVCGMSVRQKREGEAEVEATLKVAIDVFDEVGVHYVGAVQTGEEIVPPDCAFSIFLPREGASLWDIAKELKKLPEDVAAENPTLEFPVKRGERIVVYRQKA